MSVASEKGFVFVSILLTLMVIGGMYIYFSSGSESSPLNQAKANSGIMACRTSVMSLERVLLTWEVTNPGRPPTVEGLKAQGVKWPECPGGGRYVIQDGKVSCTLHSEQEHAEAGTDLKKRLGALE